MDKSIYCPVSKGRGARLHCAGFGYAGCDDLLGGDDFAILVDDLVHCRGLGVLYAERHHERPTRADDGVIGQGDDRGSDFIRIRHFVLLQRASPSVREEYGLIAVDDFHAVRFAENPDVHSSQIQRYCHVFVALASSTPYQLGDVLRKQMTQVADFGEPIFRHSGVSTFVLVPMGEDVNVLFWCVHLVPLRLGVVGLFGLSGAVCI